MIRTFGFILCSILPLTQALSCWQCHNAPTNDHCLRHGQIVQCNEMNAICLEEVRHFRKGSVMLIEKRCKQDHACNNNVMQNPRDSYPIQCNTKSPTSTCRCCCNTDLCNTGLLACWNNMAQFDSPDDVVATCASRPTIPSNSNMQCLGNMKEGSTCDFHCHEGYYMVGEPQLTCSRVGRNFTWNYPEPECHLITCPPPPVAPQNGFVTCTDGINLRSQCTYSCEPEHVLIGSSYSVCRNVGGERTGQWSATTPTCRPLVCPSQSLRHGSISCSRGRKFRSNCNFECDTDYQLHPVTITGNTCGMDGNWSTPIPCCTRPCPPFAVMDFIVVLDSSSSVGRRNWLKMKRFVRSFLDDFAVRDEFARFGIVRYNRVVDTRTQILLSDFPNSLENLLAKFELMPYNGSGTKTGNALNHTADVMLTNGNRPSARDIVLLITDGLASDDVAVPAQRVRDTGALMMVLPVQPPNGRTLNLDQFRVITGPGNENNIIKDALTRGFDALDEEFAGRIGSILCGEPCSN
uniref:E-selectin-like n=1 Tax=Ciona intestinalis TaxID=7719 RepID=UPI000521B565|nr:E-selectin-like [Ciona intestinalis]|eukprot:XP_002122040.3 E-selectin-like [Ciona intestinalis]